MNIPRIATSPASNFARLSVEHERTGASSYVLLITFLLSSKFKKRTLVFLVSGYQISPSLKALCCLSEMTTSRFILSARSALTRISLLQSKVLVSVKPFILSIFGTWSRQRRGRHRACAASSPSIHYMPFERTSATASILAFLQDHRARKQPALYLTPSFRSIFPPTLPYHVPS